MTSVTLSRDLGHLMGYLNGETQTYVRSSCRNANDVTECPVSVQNWLLDVANIPEDKLSFAAKQARKQNIEFKSMRVSLSKTVIPGPEEVERALSRLTILPNPDDPAIAGNEDKYVESPWAVTAAPTVNPSVYDLAVQQIVRFDELVGTDPFLKRKRVIKHIEAMGQALTPFRSLPIVADDGTRMIILDGHHRLMAQWLLGQETAPIWKVEI